MLAGVDDQRGADRLPALRAARAARQDRHAELAADVDDRAHVVVRCAARRRRPGRPGRSTRRSRSGRAIAASNSTSPSTCSRSRRARATVAGLRGAASDGGRVRSARRSSAAVELGVRSGTSIIPWHAGVDWQCNGHFPVVDRVHFAMPTRHADPRHHPGRHFLQIPGTDQRARPRAARDRPARRSTIAVPSSRELARTVLDGMKRVFKTTPAGRDLSGVGHRRVGSRARQHAVARRPRADVRDRPLRDAVAATGRAARARRRLHSRRLAPRRRSRPRSSASCADDAAHAIKAVCVVHNETSTGVASRIAAVRAAIDRAGHPALLMVDTISSLASIDYRHDEWGVDVTVGGSQKGLMLPPGLSFNAISDKALAATQVGAAAALVLGLGRDARDQRQRLSSRTRRRPTCSTDCARRSTMLQRGRPRQRVRAPRPPRRSDAARGARLGARDPVRAIPPNTAARSPRS